jgi:hypothetical protein
MQFQAQLVKERMRADQPTAALSCPDLGSITERDIIVITPLSFAIAAARNRGGQIQTLTTQQFI